MRKILSFLSIVLLFFGILVGCEEKDIELYKNTRYLSFQSSRNDTLAFSFFLTLEEEYDFPIIVNLTGDTLKNDEEFVIQVDTGSTLSQELFILPQKFIFRKGVVSDTFNIHLKNHPSLKTKEFLLKLNIKGNETFTSTGGIWSQSVLSVTDIAIPPAWWVEDYTVIAYYLGEYSRKKFELLMEATGVSDMSKMSDGEKRIVALRFKHWLEDRDPIPDEENGGFISVPVMG